MPGENIHVYEKRTSSVARWTARRPGRGVPAPGGRMFNFPTYECTWNLFRSIPSLEDDTTIKGEMDEFNEKHETYAEARLVGADQEILDVSSYGLTRQHRLSLLRLLLTPEERLGETRIEEWFDETFFDTTFWYLWATTFAFQPWHSAAEMRRYMQRFTREFPRLHTLSGVSRTKYNQYDSVVRPLRRWLGGSGVSFEYGHEVTDMDIVPSRTGRTVERLYCETDSGTETVPVEPPTSCS